MASMELKHSHATAQSIATQGLANAGEGMRMHVLVWRDRMDRWEFSEAPEGVIPKKKRRRDPTTKAEMRKAYPKPYVGKGNMRINTRKKRLQTQAEIMVRALNGLMK
jgi:hypothetical protein